MNGKRPSYKHIVTSKRPTRRRAPEVTTSLPQPSGSRRGTYCAFPVLMRSVSESEAREHP